MRALTLTLAALFAMYLGSTASAAVVVHAGPVHVSVGEPAPQCGPSPAQPYGERAATEFQTAATRSTITEPKPGTY